MACLTGYACGKCREDSQHSLPPLPGGVEYVGGSVQEEGHRGRPHVQGAPEGTGIMQGVRGVDGGRITEESSDESTWEGGEDMTKMKNPGRGGRATDFLNDITSEGRPAKLPSGGIPGLSGDEDSNAGALTALACPRHRGQYGIGKPPPPTVRPMQHAGPLTGPERQSPCHIPVCQGSGAEEAAARGGRVEGEIRAGL